jgi:hypothetical protein
MAEMQRELRVRADIAGETVHVQVTMQAPGKPAEHLGTLSVATDMYPILNAIFHLGAELMHVSFRCELRSGTDVWTGQEPQAVPL